MLSLGNISYNLNVPHYSFGLNGGVNFCRSIISDFKLNFRMILFLKFKIKFNHPGEHAKKATIAMTTENPNCPIASQVVVKSILLR